MPLTKKGNKIMQSMREEYGAKKGKSVFYASRNKGTIRGVDPESAPQHKYRKLASMRRTFEDHMREQEDALMGEHEPDPSDPGEEAEDETAHAGKRGKLRKGKHT